MISAELMGISRIAQRLQPLLGKVLDEGQRFGVCEHALDLSLEVLPQLARGRQARELVVGNRTPQRKR